MKTAMKSLTRLRRWLTGLPAAVAEFASYQLWLRQSYIPVAGGADVSGQRSTGNTPAGIMRTDMSSKILELEPDAAPLLQLSKRARSEVAIKPKYSWWEDQLEARFDTQDGGAIKGATDIDVNAGTQWFADDLGYNSRTGEIFRVVSVATNKLTVVRGVGTTAAAMNDTDELINIGSAAQEGALDKAAHSDNPVEVVNYTQIFRRPWDTTGTRKSTQDVTSPSDWDRQSNKKGIEHSKDIEYHAMLGAPSVDTTDTNPRRTTGGYKHFATQNITDVGGAMTEQEFFDACRPVFRYGGRTKLALAAAHPVDIVNAFPRGKLQVQQSSNTDTFGLRVMQVITPHGNLNFVTHWLLEGAELQKHIWMVDLTNVGYKYLHGDDGSRDTHIRHDIQAPGADGTKDEYLTECGFIIGQPLTHGQIIGITS